ncbi:MAG: outer membrane beta-barrel protein [Chitinophagaceae bacterium]|nr:outer membrane beta-barrel protein [Chitinophagaceae bacterium]
MSEQADQHRMYASDGVWRKIQDRLHGKDRWPALTFGAILTTAVISVVLTFTYPQKRSFNSPADYSSISASSQNVAMIQPANKTKDADPAASVVKPVALLPVDKLSSADVISDEMGISTDQPLEQNNYMLFENGVYADNASNPVGLSEADANQGRAGSFSSAQTTASGFINNKSGENSHYQAPALQLIKNEPLYRQVETTGNAIIADQKTQEKLVLIGENISSNTFRNSTMAYGPAKPDKSISGKNRWSLQLYATPSISYRYLLEDKKYIDNPSANNGPLAPYLTNPASDFVNHKPKLGLEVGTAFIYQLTENFRVKTGLQANYRQYGIQAYATNAQPAMLTLNRENGIDSIIRFSSLSTQSGYKQMNLSSNFLQLAVPVGFDMKIADTRTVDFYVSAAGQFTYQLASSYYILSDDYKNYLKQPGIDRKFNINTAVEAFASFEAGGITWQAGPQIRYQLLPGSKDVYPIREHLIDYGFKVGVVKTLK